MSLMARKASITQEQVSAAADKLTAAGQSVSLASVLAALNTGASKSTLLPLMQNWRNSQERLSNTAIDDTVDAGIVRAIAASLAGKIKEATSVLNSKIAESQEALNGILQENEQQEMRIDELEAALSESQETAQSQAGQLIQLKSELARAIEGLESESKAHKTTITQLAKSELQLESLPSLREELASYRTKFEGAIVEAAGLKGELEGRKQI
jgi:chromosome segregation ATPase